MPPNASGGGNTLGSATNYPVEKRYPWSVVVTGITGTDVADYEAAYSGPTGIDLLEAAHLEGSPYEAVEAIDPEPEITKINTKLDELFTAIDDMAEDDDIESAITAATTYYDTHVDSTANIDDAVNSFEARTDNAFLRSVARANAGAWSIRAVQGSQHGLTLANMENARAIEINDYHARLSLVSHEKRSDHILRIADAWINYRTRRIEANRVAAQLQFDVSKLAHTMRQDALDWNIEMEVKDAEWPMKLHQDFLSMISSMDGAVVARPQTRRERLASAVMLSANIGLQSAAVFGNPLAGLLLGGAYLGTQLYAMG